jgi:hypothetical protein
MGFGYLKSVGVEELAGQKSVEEKHPMNSRALIGALV